jgi:hypothetical protein
VIEPIACSRCAKVFQHGPVANIVLHIKAPCCTCSGQGGTCSGSVHGFVFAGHVTCVL